MTDDSACAAVYNAHVAFMYAGDTTKVGVIGIVRVDSTRYVVEDVHRRAGEFGLLDIYDNSLHYLASVTQ